jgi:glyoxylase-like metal-dependent hydrolase (beta-lactamase superfamily II)
MKKNWFTIKKINQQVYALAEFSHWEKVISYLIIADDQAFLIDSGMGYESISQVVKKITTKKVTLLLTHAHWDHIGSASQFADVWIFDHPFEKESLQKGFHSDEINELKQKFFYDHFSSKKYHAPGIKDYQLLHANTIITTQDFSIQIIHTPGHTPGSVCFFIPEKGWLFSGDTIYNGPLYAQLPESDVEAYQKSLRTLDRMKSKITTIFPGHNTCQEGAGLIDQAILAIGQNEL